MLDQNVEAYVELARGEPYSTRAWLLHEHAARSHGDRDRDRFQMDLSREAIVRDVLAQVNGATVAQLRRGPRVIFSESGEIGDDQGGCVAGGSIRGCHALS